MQTISAPSPDFLTLIVNGVEANGPGVTASAISSVKIDNNPYSALYARPGRARIELTTEPGTPQFHGSATFLYRDSLFDATEPFATVKPGEQRTYLEGSLTGPLSTSKPRAKECSESNPALFYFEPRLP